MRAGTGRPSGGDARGDGAVSYDYHHPQHPGYGNDYDDGGENRGYAYADESGYVDYGEPRHEGEEDGTSYYSREDYARPGPWADAHELLPMPVTLSPSAKRAAPDDRHIVHHHEPSAHPHPRPAPRFVVKFPESWEESLRCFDDTLIRWLQRPSGSIVTYLCLAITACTTIELAFVIPVVLFVTGWDSVATQFTYLALVTALTSQVPKRFLWRTRPYLANRAQIRRKDKTSSFPSRAVTCGFVYAFAVCYAYFLRSHPETVEWWMPVLLIVAPLLASFARINLGVHYPSDCIGGVIQALIVCVLGTLLWEADVLGCGSCGSDICYSEPNQAITWEHIGRANWWVFVGLFVGMAALVGLSLAKPIEFWTKCDRVFGMLFPCIAFRATFLCPESFNDHASLPSPSPWPPAWYWYIAGIALAAILTVLGMANKGRYPFWAYVVFFFITFFSLSWWRLFVTA